MILPIKKKWFDMILAGEKGEEYREIKPYHRSRFQNLGLLDPQGRPTTNQAWVQFRNGYSGHSPTFCALVRLDIKTGRPDWGAIPGQEYYTLRVLKIER